MTYLLGPVLVNLGLLPSLPDWLLFGIWAASAIVFPFLLFIIGIVAIVGVGMMELWALAGFNDISWFRGTVLLILPTLVPFVVYFIRSRYFRKATPS